MVASTINFARKNYADYFPENPPGKDKKLVGNTIKSKRLNAYIANFLDKAILYLLQGNGKAFIKEYYDYIEKLYNYKIPIRDIASKGKIKKTIAQYQKDIKEITKAGRPKSRQAWYELVLKEGLEVNTGDTIYYINTGKLKSHPDVKKVTHYYDADGTEISKEVDRAYNKYNKENKGNKRKLAKAEWLTANYPTARVDEEIILNCVLVPRDVIDSDEDVYCHEGFEYNSVKYIDAFNKRITPLLVCFSREIRDKILVSNPDDRKYFTEEECALVHGEPNKPGDQDTYEQLMTMEDKEIKFWSKYGLTPPFLEPCGMGKWEDILADYNNRMQREQELGIDKEKQRLEQAIYELSSSELSEFIEEGTVPNSILKIADLDPSSFDLMSKTYPEICIGTLRDILDAMENKKQDTIGEIERSEAVGF